MEKLFYTTNISADLAHHEIFHSKDDKGGISLRQCHLILMFDNLVRVKKYKRSCPR